MKKNLILLFAAVITLMASCKKDNKEIVAEPLSGEAIEITEAAAAGSPSVANVVEKIDSLLFPIQKASRAGTSPTGTTDFVDFNDSQALSIIPDHAASMFATSPFYIQQLGNAWVHVKENNNGNYKPAFKSNYGHYHLSYQNFTPCYKENGTFGKPIGGGCANMTPVNEPRKLETHNNYQWIKIYAYDYNNPARVFDLLRIKVTIGPIQLWFKKNNGGWYKWSSIGTGTWNLSAYSKGITEVLISSAHNGPIGFDDVKIKMPSY